MSLRITIYALVCLAVCAFIAVTSALLPEVVASRFSLSGEATNTGSREAYRNLLLMAVLIISLPGALVAWLLPRIDDSSFNLPHREFWLAPQRRARTLQHIVDTVLISVGSALVLVGVLHAAVLVAHQSTPPAFPNALFFTAIVGYFVFLALLLWRFFRHFQTPADS